MGNWRSVQVIGTCATEDVNALREAITVDHETYENFHPLSYSGPSLLGLGDWVAEQINAVGNLAERDFSIDEVAQTLESLVAVAPSLVVKIHCGGDYEDKKCIATITSMTGEVQILEPEIAYIPEITKEQITARMFMALMDR